jgi:hypothetical protein
MTPTKLIDNIILQIVNPGLKLLLVLAFFFFLWGVLEMIKGAASDTERSKGRNHMLWGIVGMAIMASAFGISNLICDTVHCDEPISRVE